MTQEEIDKSFIIIPLKWWEEFKKLAFKETIIKDVIELEEKHGRFITPSDEVLRKLKLK